MAAVAFEKGAGLNCKGFVQDVAFDVARRAEKHLSGPNAAFNAAANGHVIGKNLTMNEGLLADHQTRAVHVAFHSSIDLDVTTG